MKIALVNYQTVHTVVFRETTLTENEVNIYGYRLKQSKIRLQFSSQKIVNKTESKLSQKIVNETESILIFIDQSIYCSSQS